MKWALLPLPLRLNLPLYTHLMELEKGGVIWTESWSPNKDVTKWLYQMSIITNISMKKQVVIYFLSPSLFENGLVWCWMDKQSNKNIYVYLKCHTLLPSLFNMAPLLNITICIWQILYLKSDFWVFFTNSFILLLLLFHSVCEHVYPWCQRMYDVLVFSWIKNEFCQRNKSHPQYKINHLHLQSNRFSFDFTADAYSDQYKC